MFPKFVLPVFSMSEDKKEFLVGIEDIRLRLHPLGDCMHAHSHFCSLLDWEVFISKEEITGQHIESYVDRYIVILEENNVI